MTDSKIIELIKLLRLELPLAAGVSVLLGEIIALGRFPPVYPAVWGFICGVALSASALILNDVFDLEIDRVNAPERPLPAGLISKEEALGFSVPVTLAGLAAAIALGPAAFTLACVIWLIGFAYNWKFKRSGLLGNSLVAISVAATFILGAIAVDQLRNKVIWFFAAGAFLIDLAEEIAGDAMDIEGDKLIGSRSLAIQYGRVAALRVSAAILFLVLILTFVPIIFNWLGFPYLLAVIVMDLAIVIYTVRLLRCKNSMDGTAAMRGIYLGILAGMLVYILTEIIS